MFGLANWSLKDFRRSFIVIVYLIDLHSFIVEFGFTVLPIPVAAKAGSTDEGSVNYFGA